MTIWWNKKNKKIDSLSFTNKGEPFRIGLYANWRGIFSNTSSDYVSRSYILMMLKMIFEKKEIYQVEGLTKDFINSLANYKIYLIDIKKMLEELK